MRPRLEFNRGRNRGRISEKLVGPTPAAERALKGMGVVCAVGADTTCIWRPRKNDLCVFDGTYTNLFD